MKDDRLIYTITVNTEYNDGTQRSYVKRITTDRELAESLMQSVYDDAKEGRSTKVGVYSNPEWIDEKHTVLKVLCTCYIGYMSIKYPETYSLNREWESRLYSEQTWILE